MESTEIFRQVQELEANAKRYEAASKRFVAIASRIDEMADELHNMSKELDPFRSTMARIGKRSSYKEIYDELLEKMRAGTVVTKALIGTTYSLTDVQAQNIMNVLQRMKVVEKMRDGKMIRLTLKGGTDA